MLYHRSAEPFSDTCLCTYRAAWQVRAKLGYHASGCFSRTYIFSNIFGSPGIPVVTGQNSLSRRARPLEILGRPLNDVLFSREFRESQLSFIIPGDDSAYICVVSNFACPRNCWICSSFHKPCSEHALIPLDDPQTASGPPHHAGGWSAGRTWWCSAYSCVRPSPAQT